MPETPAPRQTPWQSRSGLTGYIERGVLYLSDTSPAQLARENMKRIESQRG